MFIQFNNVWLTNDGTGTNFRAITPACGVKLKSGNAVDIQSFVRGLQRKPVLRNNQLNGIDFTVVRNFQLLYPNASNPVSLAELFGLTHAGSFTAPGQLVMITGAPGESAYSVIAQYAALSGLPSIVIKGARVEVTYSFQCGLMVEGPVPGTVLGTGSGGAILGDGAGGQLGTGPQ